MVFKNRIEAGIELAKLLQPYKSKNPISLGLPRGGRVDLAGESLEKVKAPTLMIVGGNDGEVLDLNRQAQRLLTCENEFEIIPGATHLFEEPGALEAVAEKAGRWFLRYLK